MSNMSYCRFRNTLSDLRDCRDNLTDFVKPGSDEAKARFGLVKTCQAILEELGFEVVTSESEAQPVGDEEIMMALEVAVDDE